MKKIITLLAIAAFFFAGVNEASAQISVGAGSGSRAYLFTDAQGVTIVGAAPTLSVDFEANFRLARLFAVSVGADLAGVAGYHFMKDNTKNLGEIYFNVPVRAKLYIPISRQVELYIFGGPVASLDCLSIDAHVKGTTNNFEQYPTLTRFDVMLGGGLGIEIIKHIRATVGYDYGLIDRDTNPNRRIHTGVLKAAAYYMF